MEPQFKNNGPILLIQKKSDQNQVDFDSTLKEILYGKNTNFDKIKTIQIDAVQVCAKQGINQNKQYHLQMILNIIKNCKNLEKLEIEQLSSEHDIHILMPRNFKKHNFINHLSIHSRFLDKEFIKKLPNLKKLTLLDFSDEKLDFEDENYFWNHVCESMNKFLSPTQDPSNEFSDYTLNGLNAYFSTAFNIGVLTRKILDLMPKKNPQNKIYFTQNKICLRDLSLSSEKFIKKYYLTYNVDKISFCHCLSRCNQDTKECLGSMFILKRSSPGELSINVDLKLDFLKHCNIENHSVFICPGNYSFEESQYYRFKIDIPINDQTHGFQIFTLLGILHFCCFGLISSDKKTLTVYFANDGNLQLWKNIKQLDIFKHIRTNNTINININNPVNTHQSIYLGSSILFVFSFLKKMYNLSNFPHVTDIYLTSEDFHLANRYFEKPSLSISCSFQSSDNTNYASNYADNHSPYRLVIPSGSFRPDHSIFKKFLLSVPYLPPQDSENTENNFSHIKMVQTDTFDDFARFDRFYKILPPTLPEYLSNAKDFLPDCSFKSKLANVDPIIIGCFIVYDHPFLDPDILNFQAMNTLYQTIFKFTNVEELVKWLEKNVSYVRNDPILKEMEKEILEDLKFKLTDLKTQLRNFQDNQDISENLKTQLNAFQDNPGTSKNLKNLLKSCQDNPVTTQNQMKIFKKIQKIINKIEILDQEINQVETKLQKPLVSCFQLFPNSKSIKQEISFYNIKIQKLEKENLASETRNKKIKNVSMNTFRILQSHLEENFKPLTIHIGSNSFEIHIFNKRMFPNIQISIWIAYCKSRILQLFSKNQIKVQKELFDEWFSLQRADFGIIFQPKQFIYPPIHWNSLCFAGPNGAGKSGILHSISTQHSYLFSPSDGKPGITFKEISDYYKYCQLINSKAFEIIQTIFQDIFKISIHWERTLDPPKVEFLPTFSNNNQQINLSSGQKKLLSMLVSIVVHGEKYPFILLDEPESALEINIFLQLIQTLIKNWNTKTFIFSTHSIQLFKSLKLSPIVFLFDKKILHQSSFLTMQPKLPNIPLLKSYFNKTPLILVEGKDDISLFTLIFDCKILSLEGIGNTNTILSFFSSKLNSQFLETSQAHVLLDRDFAYPLEPIRNGFLEKSKKKKINFIPTTIVEFLYYHPKIVKAVFNNDQALWTLFFQFFLKEFHKLFDQPFNKMKQHYDDENRPPLYPTPLDSQEILNNQLQSKSPTPSSSEIQSPTSSASEIQSPTPSSIEIKSPRFGNERKLSDNIYKDMSKLDSILKINTSDESYKQNLNIRSNDKFNRISSTLDGIFQKPYHTFSIPEEKYSSNKQKWKNIQRILDLDPSTQENSKKISQLIEKKNIPNLKSLMKATKEWVMGGEEKPDLNGFLQQLEVSKPLDQGTVSNPTELETDVFNICTFVKYWSSCKNSIKKKLPAMCSAFLKTTEFQTFLQTNNLVFQGQTWPEFVHSSLFQKGPIRDRLLSVFKKFFKDQTVGEFVHSSSTLR